MCLRWASAPGAVSANRRTARASIEASGRIERVHEAAGEAGVANGLFARPFRGLPPRDRARS